MSRLLTWLTPMRPFRLREVWRETQWPVLLVCPELAAQMLDDIRSGRLVLLDP